MERFNGTIATATFSEPGLGEIILLAAGEPPGDA
jgi:hypothetical protein